MEIPLDFRELLEEFAREGVEYLLVGGYAVAFHARPRATKDIDLWVAGGTTQTWRVSRAPLRRSVRRLRSSSRPVEWRPTRSCTWASRHCGSTCFARSQVSSSRPLSHAAQ